MIDVKQGVRIAIDYFLDLYENQKYANVLVEEVELDEDYWLITVGYDTPTRETLGDIAGPRRYKTFEIHSETGDVHAMKIRIIEHA